MVGAARSRAGRGLRGGGAGGMRYHPRVSESAVEKHISAIFMKLDLEDDRDTNRRVKAVIMFLGVDR